MAMLEAQIIELMAHIAITRRSIREVTAEKSRSIRFSSSVRLDCRAMSLHLDSPGL